MVQITYESSAAYIREARKAGYGGTFYNVSFVGTQALADELGREAHGMVISQVMPRQFSTTVRCRRYPRPRWPQPGATPCRLFEHGG